MDDLSWVGDPALARRLRRCLDDIPAPENRRTVERYLLERRAGGIKDKTLLNEANALRGYCCHLGDVRVEDSTREHVLAYFANATTRRKWVSRDRDGNETTTHKTVKLAGNTLAVRKTIIKAFYRWHRGTDEYPPEVRGIRSGRRDLDKIPVDQLIISDDLDRLLTAHHHARDKAIIAVLYESGLREGEFCSLRIGSVEFDHYGAVILLPVGEGKTGARRIRLVDSADYLQAWVEAHPFKNDRKTPLWLNLSKRSYLQALQGPGLWSFVKRAAKRAGITKNLYPHLFRHSSATEKARLGWREGELRAYFGWSRGSDMPSRYVHLAGLDYEDMMLERLGKKPRDHARTRALAPRVCPDCRTENVSNASFCKQCRRPISPTAETEIRLNQRKQVELEVKRQVARMIAGELKEELARQLREGVEGAT